jgi:glycosyltransferase involved in cell wall biosynthesis
VRIAVLIPPVVPDPGVVGFEGIHTVTSRLSRQLVVHGHTLRLILPGGKADLQPHETVVVPMPKTLTAAEARAAAQGAAARTTAERLAAALEGFEVCVALDVLFNAFCLPITVALRRAVLSTGTRLVFYSFECTRGLLDDFDWREIKHAPWSAVAETAAETTLAFPAAATRQKIAVLTGLPLQEWHLLPPVLDLALEPHLDATAVAFWTRRGLWEAQAVLLLPALNRINNNIDKAIHVVAALKRRGYAARLLLTYLRRNWWAGNSEHFTALKELARAHDVDGDVVFLTEEERTWVDGLPRLALNTLYALCDGVILPTEWEGFGLVAVEAAIARAPLICADLPVLREVVGDAAAYFDLADDDDAVAEAVVELLRPPEVRGRRRMALYTDTEAHYERFVRPLLDLRLPDAKSLVADPARAPRGA